MKRNSRRDQVLLMLLALTSISLIVIDRQSRDQSPLDGLRSAAAVVFGPAERVIGSIAGSAGDVADRLRDRPSDKAADARVVRENAQLRRQLRTSELARNRAAELDRLLGVAAAGQYRTVPAEVVAMATQQSLGRTITIDAGSRDGIARDMTVINADGLVGRVRTVGPWTSTVLLAVDPGSSVGVRLESTMEIGIASGTDAGSRDSLTLELLDTQANVAPGDRLVTFGSRGNRPYVAGVPVGVVTQVKETPGTLTRTALLSPYVDFTALDLVGVVVEPPREDPRDSVLPPRPTPSATPSTGR